MAQSEELPRLRAHSCAGILPVPSQPGVCAPRQGAWGNGGGRHPPRNAGRDGGVGHPTPVRVWVPGTPCGDRGTLVPMSDGLPLEEVRAELPEIVARVERRHARVTVTRGGRPVAVLINAGDLASLEETLALLSDPEAVSEIDQAREDVRAGRSISGDELAARFADFDPGQATDMPVEAYLLQRAARQLTRSEQELVDTVVDARAAGLSWQSIGAALGTSAPEARQRYGAVADRP